MTQFKSLRAFVYEFRVTDQPIRLLDLWDCEDLCLALSRTNRIHGAG